MTVAARAGWGPARRLGFTDGVFAVAVFAGAALTFVVEPLVGKLLLPSLGGSPAIWNTTLAFFQAALLAGYGYAHLLQRLPSVRRQAALHLVVLVLAAAVLPLRVSTLFGPPWTSAPAPWLFLVLLVSLGPPFAAVSATAPLLQAWHARLRAGGDGGSPYRLYAASNLGSLLALAAYPTVIEPLLGLRAQSLIWSIAYAGFVLVLGAAAVAAWRTPAAPVQAAAETMAGASWRDRIRWLLLAAAPSSLLLGVTSAITSDVASVPFLWVLPLELYLLAFVIAFAVKPLGPPGWLLPLQILGAAAALISFSSAERNWAVELVIHLAAFAVTTLVCCLSLAARRPEPARLTEFYLWVAIGGVAGGAFNAFLAPVLFDRVWEYPAVLILSLLAWRDARARLGFEHTGWLVVGLVCPLALLIPHLRPPDFLRWALLAAPAVMALLLQRHTRAVAMLMTMLAFVSQVQGFGAYDETMRSFFGVVRIGGAKAEPLGPVRVMVHGVTLHGVQALDPRYRCTPTSYYAPGTVIGRTFAREAQLKPALRTAVVGLGAGTVATFVRPQDAMTFFEIDPLMAKIALDARQFTFLNGCAKGPVSVVIGDARLSLRRMPSGLYDLMLVDGFSSDSIPTHLLTLEAVRDYLRLLKPDGVLLLHLSNRNLALQGPAAAAVRDAGGSALYGVHWMYGNTSAYVDASESVLVVAHDPATLARYRGDFELRAPRPDVRPWTDDHTQVFGALIARMSGRAPD